MVKMLRFLSFKGLNYGIYTTIIALIPVTFTIIVLQSFVNISDFSQILNTIEIQQSSDITLLMYYLIFGVVHILICIIITHQFALTNKANTNIIKLKIVRNVRTFFLISMISLVYLIDHFGISLAYLSHNRLYILMEKSLLYKPYFNSHINTFHLFSIFPFVLISIALVVMVYAGFNIGNEMYNFIYKKDIKIKDIKLEIKNLNLILKNYARLLSVVMVSSTVATILFFQLPIPLIKHDWIRESYSNTSLCIGISWGVVFSLTLLFLCIYPYRIAHKKISEIINSEKVRSDPNLESWIDKHKNYYTFMWNLQLLSSVISPAASGILTAIISHFL